MLFALHVVVYYCFNEIIILKCLSFNLVSISKHKPTETKTLWSLRV